MTDEPEHSGRADDESSLGDVLEQLGRDTSRLALHEAALSASRHAPQLRQVALGAGAVAALVLAFLAAFALVNWAAVDGLSAVMPTWLAALVLAAVWLVVGIVLAAILRARLLRGSAGVWIRVLGDDRAEAVAHLEASRDEAERSVRTTLSGLDNAVAAAAAEQMKDALVPFASGMGEELLEASEDLVDAIEDNVPGGTAVGQIVDIVLFPGRLGLRVATTVLRGDGSTGTRS